MIDFCHQYICIILIPDVCNQKRYFQQTKKTSTKAGSKVKYASSDADTLIVMSAIEAFEFQNVTLVGDDTGLLDLLDVSIDL